MYGELHHPGMAVACGSKSFFSNVKVQVSEPKTFFVQWSTASIDINGVHKHYHPYSVFRIMINTNLHLRELEIQLSDPCFAKGTKNPSYITDPTTCIALCS